MRRNRNPEPPVQIQLEEMAVPESEPAKKEGLFARLKRFDQTRENITKVEQLIKTSRHLDEDF